MSLERAKHGWEYIDRFIAFNQDDADKLGQGFFADHYLNQWGSVGWELVEMLPCRGEYNELVRGYIAIFKRPLKDPI